MDAFKLRKHSIVICLAGGPVTENLTSKQVPPIALNKSPERTPRKGAPHFASSTCDLSSEEKGQHDIAIGLAADCRHHKMGKCKTSPSF